MHIEPRKPWQIWQMFFNEVVQSFAQIDSSGPAAFIIIAKDLDGSIQVKIEGTKSDISDLHKRLGEYLKGKT